jgi:hypothetical protein
MAIAADNPYTMQIIVYNSTSRIGYFSSNVESNLTPLQIGAAKAGRPGTLLHTVTFGASLLKAYGLRSSISLPFSPPNNPGKGCVVLVSRPKAALIVTVNKSIECSAKVKETATGNHLVIYLGR